MATDRMNHEEVARAARIREDTERDRRANTARVERMTKSGCPLHEFARRHLSHGGLRGSR